MANDSEIRKTFDISFIGDDIIALEFRSNVDDVEANIKQADLIRKDFLAVLEQRKRPIGCLVNLGPIKKTALYPSPEARDIYAQIMAHPNLGRIAVIAPNVLLRSIMRFVVSASKKRGISLFKSRAKAIDWLKK